jgi:hypothetical protein
MFSGGHRKSGYTYHNMLTRELPVMTKLLPVNAASGDFDGYALLQMERIRASLKTTL